MVRDSNYSFLSNGSGFCSFAMSRDYGMICELEVGYPKSIGRVKAAIMMLGEAGLLYRSYVGTTGFKVNVGASSMKTLM